VAGKRDETKAETRAALIAAALVEFAERGLDSPSLDAICARAGYTRGAFYVHFRDRDDLLAAAMEQVIGAWLETIAATTDPAYDLHRTVDRFANAFVAVLQPGLDARGHEGAAPGPLALGVTRFHLVLEAVGRSPVVRERFVAMIGEGVRRVEAVARAGQAAGTVRSDLDPTQAASLLTTLALGLLCVAQSGVPFDPDGARRLLLQLMAPLPSAAPRLSS
jgi:TetR/AcrR family transcriptional repressor of nem operon